jgi:hypothetical protein
VPSISSAGTVNIQGILKDANGDPIANAAIILSSTKDKTTYPDSLIEVAHSTTDENGFYSFTVQPGDSDVHYYYLINTSANPPTSEYLGEYKATASTTAAPLDLTMIAIIVVVIVVVIAVLLLLLRRRKK